MKRATSSRSARPARRQRAALVVADAQPLGDEIVDQRIGRAGVEGDDFAVRAEIGDVADAAPIEHRQRPLEPRAHRRVIEGNQRRAFAAGGDVGGAKIVDDVDSEHGGGARAVAELAGEPSRGRCRTVWPCRPTSATLRRVDGETCAGKPRPPRHARR